MFFLKLDLEEWKRTDFFNMFSNFSINELHHTPATIIHSDSCRFALHQEAILFGTLPICWFQHSSLMSNHQIGISTREVKG